MGMKTLVSPVWWLLKKIWWVVDGMRRALFNLILLLLLVALVWGLFSGGPKPLRDKSTLVLSFNGPLVEQFSGSARDQAMNQLQGIEPKQVRLRDVLAALEAAGKDAKISQVLLDLDGFSGAGLAGLHEVAAALQRVRAAGKKVLAYGDSFSQRAYYLAAQADEIYVHPMGGVLLDGFGHQRMYYKDALERVGISPNLLRVGTYKNAGEPYIANGPSQASLEAESYLYNELWGGFLADIEKARKLEAGSLARSIEQADKDLLALRGDMAKLALQQKLVDGIKTRDEVRALLMERGARDDKGHSFARIGLGEYLARQKPALPVGPAVGVVVAQGEIKDGSAAPGTIGGDSTAELIRQAREDDQVKAVVLRVNSPGGSAFASEVIRRELELTQKAGKPVVISMGDVAASGGYWISMSSDEVIADAGTITGSIGVFALLPTGEKLMDKLNLHTAGYTTTWLGKGYDFRTGLDPRMASAVQSSIQHIYDEFTGKAAAARKKKIDEIDAVAQGRVWTGKQALERGLIDRLGSLDDAVKAAAGRAKLEGQPRVSYIEKEPGRLEKLLQSVGDTLAPGIAASVRAQLGFHVPPALLQPQQDLAMASELLEGRKPFSTTVHCLCTAP